MVQREIVTGLKYVQKTKKMGVQVDKMVHMVGSYAPKAEPHSYLTPFEDAPSGKLGRGTYKVSSCFTDDYKNEHLKVIHHNYTFFQLNRKCNFDSEKKS